MMSDNIGKVFLSKLGRKTNPKENLNLLLERLISLL